MVHKHQILLLFKEPHGYEATEEAQVIIIKFTQRGSTRTTPTMGS